MLDDKISDPVRTPAKPSATPGQEGANGVGAELKAARLRLGWALPDVAAALRIRLSYLEALEQGHPSELPGPAYALGFLRTYAAALGLDPGELAQRFKSGTSEMTRETELSFPAPVPKRGVPAGAAVLVGLVLAVGAYVGWYRLSEEGKLPPEVVPAVPERLAPLAEQAIQTPPPPPAAAVTPPPSAATPPAPSPLAPSSPPVAPPSQVATEAPGPLLAPVPPNSAAAMAVLPAGKVADPASPAGGEEWRLVLRAKADAWMQVRTRSGQVLLSRVLHPGEVWPVPPEPDLMLSTGNAGGTELVVDGVAAPSIGNPGAIRRDLPLDPDMIRDGKLPAQMQATAAAQPSGARPASPR